MFGYDKNKCPIEGYSKSEINTKVTEINTEISSVDDKATEANTKATEANTKATEASTKAEEASTKATEANTKVTQLDTKVSQMSTPVEVWGQFIVMNVYEGTEISTDEYLVTPEIFYGIKPGSCISYTASTGTSYSRQILATQRYSVGDEGSQMETLDMWVAPPVVYGAELSSISFSIDHDYDPNIVWLGANGPYSGGGGEACFVENTKVITEDGLKNIEDIKISDYVLSYNLETNTQELNKVYNIKKHPTDTIYEIKTEHNIIKATGDHPFYNTNYEIVLAKNLSAGDSLFLYDGTKDIISEVNKIREQHMVYDIAVENNRNYYIGDNSILVSCEEVTCK